MWAAKPTPKGTNIIGWATNWVGYKTPIDTAEGGLPVRVLSTSASVHDSQAAIPMMRRSAEMMRRSAEMMRRSAERVTSLYDRMDSA